MIIDTYGSAQLDVDDGVDKDGDLHMWVDTTDYLTSLYLTPENQDKLIAHLIEVRGAGRVQELLNRSDT